MTASKIVLGAASGAAGGAVLDVDEVFSTYLWTGTNSANTIANGIDLSGEGGLVWTKWRGITNDHMFVDTERGALKVIDSNNTDAEVTNGNNAPSSFLSNGFTYTDNGSGYDIASWTFRKAPKFFNVITYSGNSTAGRTISHNLGCTVGQVWVKRTNTSNNWICWHRGIANNQYLSLNSPNQAFSDGGIFWNNTTPSSTTVTLGADSGVNATGSTYVMYVFAHNNSDGNFGPDSNQDIIKCGSYTGNGSATGPTVNLGFEPQFIMYKNVSGTGNWQLHDVMRGIPTGSNDAIVYANKNWAENLNNDWLDVNATGFQIKSSGSDANTNGETYIYMAIRRGPLAEPESASDVFAISTFGQGGSSAPAYTSNFPVDMYFERPINTSFQTSISSRLTGNKYLKTNATDAEVADSGLKYDFMDGVYNSTGTLTNYYAWMWKRAPGYFDVVAYDGNNTSGRTVSHNLGVVPEMIWIKNRGYSAGEDWAVYHKDLNGGTDPEDYFLYLNRSNAQGNNAGNFNDTAPTSTVFTVGNDRRTNGNVADGNTYIAYLFATLAGVSKVGSYTGNGSSQDIDCGFSNGAKFVLIKRTDGAGNWCVFDTARGIVSGNDYLLKLNNTDAQSSDYDQVDPLSSGFTVVRGGQAEIDVNYSGLEYIFYAIAT